MTMTKLFAGLLATLLPVSFAQAQITVDVSKITCQQFFVLKTDPDAIAIWLGGYYHGKRGDTVVDVETFKENVKMLRVACRLSDNLKLPIMQVIEKRMADEKPK